MKFKLDENVPHRAAAILRARGHNAVMLLDQVSAGAPDDRIAKIIRAEGRALVTLDLDFADIRSYSPQGYAGLIVLRPRRTDAGSVVSLVQRVATAIENEPIEGTLWIVEPARIRIRGASR